MGEGNRGGGTAWDGTKDTPFWRQSLWKGGWSCCIMQCAFLERGNIVRWANRGRAEARGEKGEDGWRGARKKGRKHRVLEGSVQVPFKYCS